MAVLLAIVLLQHQAGIGHLNGTSTFGLVHCDSGRQGELKLSRKERVTIPRKAAGLLKAFATEIIAALEHSLLPLIRVQEELQSPISLS